MAKWLKVLLIILAIVILAVILFFVLGTVKKGKPSSTDSKPSSVLSAGAPDQAAFELKKSNANYTVYYHAGDEANASKTLDVLSSAEENIYKKYLGITSQNTPVYLASTVDEYVKIADFPGGAAAVQVGDGSAPNGKIYLYKPFDDPSKGRGVIVHEGTHAAINGFFGGGQQMDSLPGFLNEGMAYNAEFIYNAGSNYDPIKEIYFADLLKKAARTGMPALMSLDELSKNCDGYISDSDRDGLCRGQGTFIVWYMADEYGENFWGKFLADLKFSGSWQKSLEKISGKNTNDLDLQTNSTLKDRVK